MVRLVELRAEDALRHLASHPPPGEPQLDILPKLAPRLPGAPDGRPVATSQSHTGRLRISRREPVALRVAELLAELPRLRGSGLSGVGPPRVPEVGRKLEGKDPKRERAEMS